ncbi:FAD-binding oxidoreductase [Streptomyces sp. UH6]|uniref:NAD(P)/FAD-dependent oxidoreductase n=1 Tax=Streptomyces sp. UH6 TaxID=2748379 RepID=UPI0015D51445|nr:FAD-dependent oxidoreductase [Streptomyces sp. UH6]NYV75674.1 FAD-dependent oxidoreductase [Streptomyces sp. UH6]
MAPGAMNRWTKSLAEARPVAYWLEDPGRPRPEPALTAATTCDLLVVGGGYSGLWTALLAKERDPGRDVLLLEGKEVGWAASGRNGGFCAASLTHGLANGLSRWPGEIRRLEELGARNLDAIEDTVARYGLDCEFERTGEIDLATEPHQVGELRALHGLMEDHGLADGIELLDAEGVRAHVNSPTFLAGLYDRRGVALVHPAKLAWELKRACRELGVRIHEHSPALSLRQQGGGVTVTTPYGSVRAGKVALATNVFPSLLRRVRPYTVPVYDYALLTEPLSEERSAALGWRGRQGLADLANQFHYFRLTADNRILWGGYDAVYRYGGRVRAEYDNRPETFAALAEQFFTCFPQLEGMRFTHAWGGAIDTCSRFAPFFGTAHRGRVGYSVGYTGLGVGATRFGAQVVLDLLDGEVTERTSLEMVRSKPLPFPPEPFAWTGIALTRWSLARADVNGGRRNVWLRALDRVGLGFDS